MTDIGPFTKLFDKLCYSHTDRTLFDDFLEMCLCAASIGVYEKEYLEIVGRYKKEEVNQLCELFALLVMGSDGDGTGFVDILGDFYMERLSHGKNGEFYTLPHICDMMAACTAPDGTTYFKKIADPACGSGRMLMAYAKQAGKTNMFYGFDIGGTAVKMCALNMWMNGLPGCAVHGNSLTVEAYGGYSIDFHFKEKLMAPQVLRLSKQEAQVFMGSLPPTTGLKKPMQKALGPPTKPVVHKQAVEQMSLFG